MFVRKPMPNTLDEASAALEGAWSQYRRRLDLHTRVAVLCGASSGAATLTWQWVSASWETATWLAGWVDLYERQAAQGHPVS